MKVLWISNTVFPDLAEYMAQGTPNVGGWMYSLAKDLSNDVTELGVVSFGNQNIESIHLKGINYFLINYNSLSTKEVEAKWHAIIQTFEPDLVHIHGTEYTFGLSLMNTFPSLKYIVSIQGLVSIYSDFYLGGLRWHTILANITFRDLIKRDTLWHGQRRFKHRGKSENEYFKNTKYFIGRTSWDKAHIFSKRQDAVYFYGGERLREGFYTSPKWTLKKRNEKIIFLSQCAYPIKGLHKVLEALAIVKREYPEIMVKIAGANILEKKKVFGISYKSGYANIILGLIKKYNLERNVVFLGNQNETQMIEQYLNADLFICPSSIENSPNSLGEAQILGVPVIAAQVGGVCDMAQHNENAMLYRFEETAVLAMHILELLNNKGLCSKLSENAIKVASKRHSKELIKQQVLQAYSKILNN
ncbi:Glycosyl transferase group 1 [Croceitalea dokdonensis DOKDO 023]|uniref:Glycosyl transferase group 1 n=1 Tax=Croceitalea dokdonensis DOKDO 023 TaxID=1300341 RepID=A0A0N8H3E6_9FLAO|nr:glycosyltransferase family 4 protein [Croceitalea dokdonensis]KPM30356.1 Glycosyl transferase group 1 [Croceitalea dokdonensis DOKDO 023]